MLPLLASLILVPSVACGEDGRPQRVDILLMGKDNLEVEGVSVGVAGQTKTTDQHGRARFHDVPQGLWTITVEPPWEIRANSVTSVQVGSSPADELVWVHARCPGPVRLIDHQGQGIPGVELRLSHAHYLQQTLITDEAGLVDVDLRLCGTMNLRAELGIKNLHKEIHVSGPGPMQVVVPKLRYAELLLVDSSGQRVQDPSAQSHAEPGTGWEQLGRGWARIWGYEPSQRVAFRSPGGSLRWARVPLDGGLHVVELSPPRQVHVEFVGPPGLRYVECVSEHAPASRACLVPGPCICPDRGAVLRPAREREILARLDDDAERITLDWSAGLASVRGRWGGTEYFDVSVDQGARIAQRSKRIRIDDLYPGEHRIQIGDGNDLLWEGWVTLAPGEQLDLGNLSPDRGFIEGRVHTSADLSTSDLLAWTASWPLDEHGKFQVGPVSVDAEVGLWFTSADFAHQAHVLARPGDWVDIYVPEPESEGLDDHWLDDARLERPVDE